MCIKRQDQGWFYNFIWAPRHCNCWYLHSKSRHNSFWKSSDSLFLVVGLGSSEEVFISNICLFEVTPLFLYCWSFSFFTLWICTVIIWQLIPHLQQFFARRFQFLCLESGLHNVQWVRHNRRSSSCQSSARKVPSVLICSIPWLHECFHVFIYTDNYSSVGNIHWQSDPVTSVQRFVSSLGCHVQECLSNTQILAQLHSLL